MSEDLQSLLDKINREGVQKAQAEADAIVSRARAEADSIVKEAKSKADAAAKAAARARWFRTTAPPPSPATTIRRCLFRRLTASAPRTAAP